MSIGSGLAASLGIAPETTYGTYVAPASPHFYEFNKFDLKKVKNVVQGGGLAAGRPVQLASQRVVPTQAGTGEYELELRNKGFGLWLNQFFGAGGSPTQQASTAAYLQTHTVGDNIGKSLTAQVGVPGRGGTVNPYTGLGGKLTTMEFACSMDNPLLTVTGDADFQQVVESQSLVAPSYTTGQKPFHFGQLSVKIGASYGSESVVTGVKGVDLKLERPQDVDGYYAGATTAGTKAEPVWDDWFAASGSLDVDLVTKADFADRFAADTQFSLIFQWTGALIASSYYEQFTLTMPASFLDGDTPTVDGPGVTSWSVPFTCQYDGTNSPVIATYMSVDTAL